jgi:hypothetical protein
MGDSTSCAEAEADTKLTLFDLSALKKQCSILYTYIEILIRSMLSTKWDNR